MVFKCVCQVRVPIKVCVYLICVVNKKHNIIKVAYARVWACNLALIRRIIASLVPETAIPLILQRERSAATCSQSHFKFSPCPAAGRLAGWQCCNRPFDRARYGKTRLEEDSPRPWGTWGSCALGASWVAFKLLWTVHTAVPVNQSRGLLLLAAVEASLFFKNGEDL